MDGWMGAKAGLRIDYSNQKLLEINPKRQNQLKKSILINFEKSIKRVLWKSFIPCQRQELTYKIGSYYCIMQCFVLCKQTNIPQFIYWKGSMFSFRQRFKLVISRSQNNCVYNFLESFVNWLIFWRLLGNSECF